MSYFWREILRLPQSSDIRFECERRNLHQLNKIEPPVIYGTVNASELHDFLPSTYVNHVDGKTYHVRKDVYFDHYYKLTSIEEIRRFLKWNLIDKEEYTLNEFDCNRFAIATMGAMGIWGRGVCFGFGIIPGHAKNWFLDFDSWKKYKETGEKTLYEVEPQSDVITITKWGISHYFIA